MESLLKTLLSAVTVAASLNSSSVLGVGLWSIVFLLLSLLLLLSIFVPRLNILSKIIARFMGISSLLAFSLLMLASTIGGSFKMSESNENIAIYLAIISFLGCCFFFIKLKSQPHHTQANKDT